MVGYPGSIASTWQQAGRAGRRAGQSFAVLIARSSPMDQFIVDLHGSAAELGVHEGDTVELFGPGRGEDYAEPTADDWARAADTISYEIFTCLRNRIPRLYLHAPEVLPPEDLAKLDPSSIL